MQHPVAPRTVFPKYELYLEQILLFIVVGIAIIKVRGISRPPPPLDPAITIPGKTVFYSIQHKYFWNRDSAASEWAFSYVYSILYIPLLHVKCLKKGIHQLENEWLLLSASLMQNLS